MAAGHPEYSQASTDELWHRSESDIERNPKWAWVGCEAIEAAGCKSCATCPHRAKGKSPLHLGLPVAPQASNIDAEPQAPNVDAEPQAPANGNEPNFFTGNQSSATPVAADPANLKVSFSNIPHRQWLYGIDLVRGDITVQGAPGGAGKTSLAIGMAVSVATGKTLLGETIWGTSDHKVLYVNAEDSRIEMLRRVWAFCLTHGVTEQELSRLFVAGTDDAQVQGLSLLRTTDRNTVLDQAGFKRLEDLICSLRPDVVVLDPLIALCGGGNVNDNAVMSLVMRELKRIAIKLDCAILIIAHTKKGGEAGSAEAISGAATIVNLARRAIMPVTMTDEESTTLRVLPSNRLSYFKVIDAKSNLAPRATDCPWYKLHGVELPNSEPPNYPYGDNVQAVVRTKLPLVNEASAARDDLNVKRAILDVIHRGKMIDGRYYPYSPSLAGAKNARALLEDAMAAVAEATAPRTWGHRDLEMITKDAIGRMKSEGWLVENDLENLIPKPKAGRFRRGRMISVNWSRTPWPNAESSTEPSDAVAPDE